MIKPSIELDHLQIVAFCPNCSDMSDHDRVCSIGLSSDTKREWLVRGEEELDKSRDQTSTRHSVAFVITTSINVPRMASPAATPITAVRAAKRTLRKSMAAQLAQMSRKEILDQCQY